MDYKYSLEDTTTRFRDNHYQLDDVCEYRKASSMTSTFLAVIQYVQCKSNNCKHHPK